MSISGIESVGFTPYVPPTLPASASSAASSSGSAVASSGSSSAASCASSAGRGYMMMTPRGLPAIAAAAMMKR